MRYRHFAQSGMALSAISLELCGDDDAPQPPAGRAEAGARPTPPSATDWRDLVHAAFEAGVNAFELVRPTPALLEGFADGSAAVSRGLLFIGFRISDAADPASLADQIAEAMAKAGLKALDLLTLDADPDQPVVGVPAVMRALRDHGLVRRLAIAGPGEVIEPYVQAGGYDAVKTPFNLLSGWRERHLIRTAVDRQMGVVGLEPCPAAIAPLIEAAQAETKPGWFKKPQPLAGIGSYAFLASTNGWSPEQLCLGYALTEPALTTVQARIADREWLPELARVADRDLPAAVSAQIEMARFSAERAAAEPERRRA